MDSSVFLIYSLAKKIRDTGAICKSKCDSKWDKLHKVTEKNGNHVVLYGTGDMFNYFCERYSEAFNIKYAVDKKAKGKTEYVRNGIPVYDLEYLRNRKDSYPIIVTNINYIDEIIADLKQQGVEKDVFSLALMEYSRKDIKKGVCLEKKFGTYTGMYKLYKENDVLRNEIKSVERMHTMRMDAIQKRQTERYVYMLHMNRVLNAVIDELGYDDLKKEQICFLFTDKYMNSYTPNIENPKTFNEKILHMQLYEKDNPLFEQVTDKYLMKKYVSDCVGEKYVVPVLGVWNRPEDIDFTVLPNQFVLKATNGGDSDRVIIVDDKSKLDIGETKRRMQSWIRKCSNLYYGAFNGTFKNVKMRILAEEKLDIDHLKYFDFKVHCFKGEPKYIHVVSHNPHTLAHHDTEWNRCELIHGYPETPYDIPKPVCLEEMLEVSRKLSAEFNYVRVDFYVLEDKLYVGELTLTTMGGMAPFYPSEWDDKWGALL